VALVSGPVNVPDPIGATIIKVETAQEMLEAVEQALPADCAIFAAAVADWRLAAPRGEKMKKQKGKPPALMLVENQDILAMVARDARKRPRLVVGFAAETDNVVVNAGAKLEAKGCDWIVANDVSPQTGIMGGDRNTVHLVTRDGIESWPPQTKDEVARALVARIASRLAGEP
jgi:phosphopantothenoylcysteine decarboxylase/phosphopantothenate--cysteine ligase